MPRATVVFGGEQKVMKLFGLAVSGTREGKGWTRAWLADLAGEGNESAVAALEECKQLPTKNTLLAYLDVLGLELQHLLRVDSLSEEEESFWVKEMKRRGVALLAGGGGPVTLSTPNQEHWKLELFLRMEALSELCAPNPASSLMDRPAALKVRQLLAQMKP